MPKFTVTYTEEIAYEVEIEAPNKKEVNKRFNNGNFPFSLAKEVGAVTKIYHVDEVEKKKLNLSQGDPL